MTWRVILLVSCSIFYAQCCQKTSKKRTKELKKYSEGKIDVIEYLIRNGANPNAALFNIDSYDDETSASIFNFITRNYHQYFDLTAGSKKYPTRQTLLLHAAQTAKKQLLAALITYRTEKLLWPIDIIAEQINEECALSACAAEKDNHEARTETAKILLQYGANINQDPCELKKNSPCLPPLHSAIKAGNIPLVAMLLEQEGINVNLQEGEDKQTPLHIAFTIENKQESEIELTIANMLLQKGANPNLTDNSNHTAHYNAAIAHIKIKEISHFIATKKSLEKRN